MKVINFGSRLSECRQNKNLTQEELAGRIGVTPQALSKWERGQSLPDIMLLTELCGILGVSADFLLGTESGNITENGNDEAQEEIWRNLRNCLEPLELTFGKDLVPAFMDETYKEKIVSVRKRLATEGILMPLVRVRDDSNLQANEFAILSYHKELHRESIEDSQNEPGDYMIQCLEQTVRDRYGDILNRDLVKDMVDNLQKKYPALIVGTVPERISYGLLTDVLKIFVKKGNSPRYVSRIIEILDSEKRRNPKVTEEELIEKVEKELKNSAS